MGTSISVAFLSANSLQNCEPREIQHTHTSRTKEQLIEDAVSEARVKLDKLRLRIRELESKKKVLLLCMEKIQNRLDARIARISKEHDKLRLVQPSLQYDNTNVTEVATESTQESSETVQCFTETKMAEDRVGQAQQQAAHAVTETVQCVTETTMAEDTVGQAQQQEAHAVTETVQCITETTMAEDTVGQAQQQEAHAVTETVQCITETTMAEDTVGQAQQQEAHAVRETVQCVTETTMAEDRVGQAQQQEAHAVTETVQCVTETTMAEDRVGQTQQQEAHVVTETPDIATATIEPYMTEQEESLLNQLLHKKLNYKQNCVVGIDVNTGIPVSQSKPHIYMTALEKSLLNKLGTMCLCDLWHRKGLKLSNSYIRHSMTQPTETEDIDDTPQGNTAEGQGNVTQADNSTNQLPESHRLDITQITNESTLTNNCTRPCNSLDSCSLLALSTQEATYCISDMLASCSQPVTDTIQVANKSPTTNHFSKRREHKRSQQTIKSTKQQIKSKSNLSSQCVQSESTAQEEVQKRPYACSYDSSFWKKLQFQPVIADNVGKENETARNQPDSTASWRNASIGDNKTTRKEPEVQILQSSNPTTPMPSVPVTDNNNLKTVSAHTSAKQQSKSGASGLNTDGALKNAIDAIRRCPQVTLSMYRLEHLTNTLESQIVYLEALSSFNMYLKAPLIMREVCAKLDPYFLWDWCQYADKTRARDNNRIHRDMLNFLKKKVYCSSLYLRPYYEESTSCTKEVHSL